MSATNAPKNTEFPLNKHRTFIISDTFCTWILIIEDAIVYLYIFNPNDRIKERMNELSQVFYSKHARVKLRFTVTCD